MSDHETRLRTAALASAAIIGGIATIKVLRKAQMESRRRRVPKHTKFVILGSGFAGMGAARELARLLPDPGLGTITLVDEHGFLLYTPMLAEVAGGELDGRHVVARPEKLSPRVTFEKARVERIDLQSREVTLSLDNKQEGMPAQSCALAADHLVIALGGVTNFHDVPGAEQHACTIKTVEEAISIRNRVIDLLQRASIETNRELQRELLTFVIAGGGYTGVETIAAVNDFARGSVPAFPGIHADDVRAVLVEPGDRLMTETTPELAAYAQRKLEHRRVEVLLNTKITEVGEGFVELERSRRIPARLVIWAGGVEPNPLIESLNVGRGKHGGISVDRCCCVPGYPGVWAIGDCAEIPNASGGTYAPTGQNASREGPHVARNIMRTLAGEQPMSFGYRPIGEMALVGKHSAVGRIYGMEFSGLLAWAMWRANYLFEMPSLAQRVRIGLDWLLDLVFGRNLAAIPY